MKKTYLCLLISTLLVACSEPAAEKSDTTGADPQAIAEKQLAESQLSETAHGETQLSETERLNNWFAEKYEQQLQRSPFYLTILGRKDKYDQVDDVSEKALDEQLAWQDETAKELVALFDYDKLTDDGKVSYDIWLYQNSEAQQSRAYRYNNYIFTQMQGMQAMAAQFLISFHRVDDVSDMHAYITRIGGMANAISTLLERAQIHAQKGVRAPRFAYEGVISQAKNLITGAPFSDGDDSALLADSKRKINALLEQGKIDQQQADDLLKQTEQALVEQWLPSYQALVNWFELDISNTDEIATGVGIQPNGKAYYDHQLKASTTTALNAEQVHQIGLSEVERLTQEMEAIKQKVGFEGSLQEFFAFIKQDDQFYYPNTDEGRQGYIDDTEVYLDFINQQLPNYFGILPKADLVVKRVEAFREQPGAAQHYAPGTPDGSRPGVYYAHLSDMRAMPKNEMEAIAYHEGNPGHHMQISIAQELTSVPQFRTQAGFTAYSEGWGLYSEFLAKEMGAYQTHTQILVA